VTAMLTAAGPMRWSSCAPALCVRASCPPSTWRCHLAGGAA
jgi:hypothetical protein